MLSKFPILQANIKYSPSMNTQARTLSFVLESKNKKSNMFYVRW